MGHYPLILFQDVLFNVDISAMYADADAVVRIAKVKFEHHHLNLLLREKYRNNPLIMTIQALMTRSAALIAAALAGVIDAISHSESFHKHSIGISGKRQIVYFRVRET